MSKRTCGEEMVLTPQGNKQQKLSCSSKTTLSSMDVIFSILQFADLFEGNKQQHTGCDDEENEEEDEEAFEENTDMSTCNIVDLMLINSEWNQVLNSNQLYLQLIAQFLNREEFTPYLKVYGYGRKTLNDYKILIDKGIFSSWKEIFINLFYKKFFNFNQLWNSFHTVLDIYEDLEEKPEYIEELKKYATLTIQIKETELESYSSLPIGASKLGGCPDLPKQYPWPTHSKYTEEDDEEEEAEVLKTFIGQINLNDLKNCHSSKGVLPATGWLFFFTGPTDEEQDWKEESTDAFYWNGDESELIRRETTNSGLKCRSLQFSEEVQSHCSASEFEDQNSHYYNRCTMMGYPEEGYDFEENEGKCFILQFRDDDADLFVNFSGKTEEFCGEETKSETVIYSNRYL